MLTERKFRYNKDGLNSIIIITIILNNNNNYYYYYYLVLYLQIYCS